MIAYVIDTSAANRFFKDPDLYPAWRKTIVRGEVGIIPPIEFQICSSARRAGDRSRLLAAMGKLFKPVVPVAGVYEVARDIQDALTRKGAHRSWSAVDLMLAATAHAEDLAVLHAGKDYETVARFWPSFRQVRLDAGAPF